ncbi:hypothetical protein IMG5_171770 [Ichthyophthirius multifiliis]|uniref:Uncharacterized protein n=1 Tax=Ichthyophthirius multifiliis TaxID=5932 RepID=G0R1N8_ICHMU|nr:hypothetical protein IMG5_171770 [Ichthyophthirius multifiliis]EGR28615.1 hypothetical protein IMG5_171770 [Ichthyophthirius multifiliis]|eukprot:XP_004029851.1 hypothetical protein IMG5_171770 [Ichthyophthirius multifiliis]
MHFIFIVKWNQPKYKKQQWPKSRRWIVRSQKYFKQYKLIEIFNDVDAKPIGFTEGNFIPGLIDLEKSKRFNKYIDDTINDNIAEKDAKDFIKSCSVCNKEGVNIDEWIFAFSKLFAVDQPAFEKFIEDYDQAVTKKGKLKNQG